jgi:3-oxoacyl-[acyl-carrier-protein] synthase-1
MSQIFGPTGGVPLFSVVSGMSCISALGMGVKEHRRALFNSPIHLKRDHRHCAYLDAPLGEVDFSSLQPGVDVTRCGTNELLKLMAVPVIDQIAQETRLFDRYRPEEIGIFIGTTTYGVDASLAAAAEAPELAAFKARVNRQMAYCGLIEKIQDAFPICGLSLCFANSCASSAIAIGEAHLALASGAFKAVLAGGFDALNPLTIMGFDALQVLNHELSSPLTLATDGINLGEGGGLVLLEHENKASSCHGRIIGYSAVNEAYHPVRPNPDGSYMKRVMHNVLTQAGLTPDDIDYINAHGTGTVANDTAELTALKDLFGQRNIYHSTKGWHGHTLGAAGGLEAIISLMALDAWGDCCGHFGFDFTPRSRRVALSNSFGFGGCNATLGFDRG